ncbi:hypothetical protein ScPMuIL_018663 [Solemya velum]
MNHRKRRSLIKKEKRKQKRQSEAHERSLELQQEEEERLKNPLYAVHIIEDEKREEAQLKWEEKERERKHQLWLLEEQRALDAIRLKKEKEEKETERIREQEQKIREEWEERQRVEKEERERNEKEAQQKKDRQEKLLQEATSNQKSGSEEWHNPIAPYNYGQERVVDKCPFFAKTGACRFGERCSRGHPLPESSTTIMLAGMYNHFELTQGLQEEYDTDVTLEYEDNELHKNFIEFYEDVIPEFKAIGRLVQAKVCCNYEPHLRGNVYIQYKHLEDAQKAYTNFNGRWYGGKQLSCQFVEIPKWKMAICGLFGKRTCPKGKGCNFLHVFRNPENEFWDADQDFNNYFPRSDRRGWNHYSSRNYSDRHGRSPSRSSNVSWRKNSRYSRSRSRSGDRSKRYRSRSRSRDRSRRRSRSRSLSRYRHRSRSHSRDSRRSSRKSRSKSPSWKSRNNSRSHSTRKSKKRSLSKSKSPRETKKNTKGRKNVLNEKMQSCDSSPRSSRSRSRSHSSVRESIKQNDEAIVPNSDTSITSQVAKDTAYSGDQEPHTEDMLSNTTNGVRHSANERKSRSSSRSSSSSRRSRKQKKHKHKKHKHKRRKSEYL